MSEKPTSPNPHDPETMRAFVTPVLRPLYRAADSGITIAREYFARIGRRVDPYLFPNLVRYHVVDALSAKDALPPNAGLEVLPNNGVQLIWRVPEIGCAWVRLWKADEGALPPARGSEAMREFYHQPFLRDAKDIFGQLSLKLAAVWDVDSSGGFTGMSLLCPKGIENPWKPGNAHWQIPVIDPATELVPAAAFTTPAGDVAALEPKKRKDTGTADNQ